MSEESVQPHQRIVQGMQEEIRQGRLRAHDKLPSTRELVAAYGVSQGTVQKALDKLRAAGLIYSHQGAGSYVSSSAASAVIDPTASAIKDLQNRVDALTVRLDNLDGRSES